MSAHKQLLATKLHIPPLQPALIPRPRLTQKLTEGICAGKLIVIAAPAGFGKTTLLTEWAHQKDEGSPQGADAKSQKDESRDIHPSSFTPALTRKGSGASVLYPLGIAWVSLDEADNDAVRFWSYAIGALEQAQPGVGQNALTLLQSLQPPPIESVLTILINNLMTIDSEIVLILDDYHVITNTAIHAALNFLLEHIPSNMHIIITSRTEPSLALSRFRVRAQLMELHLDELRFTSDEVTRFFNPLMGFDLSDDAVSALELRTEGWVAGLQLTAISMQGRTDIDNFIRDFAGSSQYLLEYLAVEAFLPQPEENQTFLLKTSILEEMNGPLCDALTSRNDSQTVLEQLTRANLFVIPLDDQRHWYRYHHLFAGLLEIHLFQSGLSIPELHLRAALWFEQEGMGDKAIQHALAAEDYDFAARLIEENAKNIIAIRGEIRMLLTWIAAFPQEWLQSRPTLRLIQAWALFLTNRLAEAQQQVTQLKHNLLDWGDMFDAGGEELSVMVVALEAQILLVTGDLSQTIEFSRYALEHLSDDALHMREIIALNLGTACWLNGDIDSADQVLAEYSDVSQAGDELSTLLSTFNLAQLHAIHGQLTQAALLYERILQLAAQKDERYLPPIVGLAHVELGHILLQWNDLDAALHHLSKGIELGQQGAGWQVLVMGYTGMALALHAQGKLNGALEMVEQIEQLSEGLAAQSPWPILNDMQVRIWMAQGNMDAVYHWKQACETSLEGVDINALDSVHLFGHITLAWVQIAVGELDAAQSLLSQLWPAAEALKHTGILIKVLILQALAFQWQGDVFSALQVLAEALSLAKSDGYIRIFSKEGDFMVQLLYLAIEQDIEVNYARRLLDALEGATPEPSSPQLNTAPNLSTPLTQREREILSLIAGGLTNQEIAGRLYLKLGTVKVHTRNIYGKLNVNSRTQAVEKVRQPGLLST